MSKREALEHAAMIKRSIYDERQAMTYNSMFYWWNRIKDMDIPTPKTEVVFHGRDAYSENFFGMLEGKMDGVVPWFDKVFDATQKFSEGPLFIRGDMTSGKHGWKKTCYVEDRTKESIFMHLRELAEDHENKLWMEGVPLLGYAVREIIPTEYHFTAFHGKMPVTREWRYFYLHGKVICRHPYWPEAAIERGTNCKYIRGDWKLLLEKINTEDKDDVEYLTEMAIKIGRAIETDVARAWSIDFLQAKDGQYYFIDCAMAEQSYHWEGCEKEEIFKIDPHIVFTEEEMIKIIGSDALKPGDVVTFDEVE